MKKNKIFILLVLIPCIIFALSLSSCAHKSGRHGRDNNRSRTTIAKIQNNDRRERKVGGHTKVSMRKEGGVYLVPITVNGLNLDFIFDTGASSISLSSAEAMVMLKQGQITQDDILGQQQFKDATGGVSVGTIVLLRMVQIGDITLENVEATVVDNIQAPLLLGQTALAKFGKVTIDYNHNTIEFN
ncbi:retroviral-like aspartic protease family protein [Prevotella sp. E13-17]|uniref:retropepsin-like aspartic protease family protein n=1 Tax=Prevotella sp. E13-17 TaxID=2913616 RepID=UPI001EDA5D8B|nr:retropepsin-like aspartic protease [Prevotella sp. E13-17]UKK51692.1 retroviral-like aspartic protease family protein [Prevotella sp. E13-17]